MPAPTFPMQPVIGQLVFFKSVAPSNRLLSYYGTVVGRQHDKWKVRTHNSTHTITFDPKTGRAKPFETELQLCWIGGAEFDGLDCDDARALAIEQMEAT